MRTQKFILPALVASIVFSAAAYAARPASDLGKAWPNATDVSASPNYHVYVFEKDGIRYVQINDASGRVRSAIANAGGALIALPMGEDAGAVQTVEANSIVGMRNPGETVYRDQTMQVMAKPKSNGTMQLTAVSLCSKDPEKCNAHAP